MVKKLLVVLILVAGFYGSKSQPLFMEDYPDSISTKRLRSVAITEIGTYTVGLYFLGGIWYKDKERVPFHYYDDSKGYLQMDKFGHAFAAYHESYAAYYALRWAGMNKRKALILGGPIGLIFQTPIEIFDGMYKGWGFSWPDMIANAFGSALFMLQEGLFDRQVVFMKYSYSPSPYPKYHEALGRTHLERFFLDYNGHTYWFSINIKSLTGSSNIPAWLNISFGYSANGMIKEFENPSWYKGKPFPSLERYRQYVFSLDLDMTQIHTRKKWVRQMLSFVNLVKIPFPALEFNRVDKFRGHFIYF